MEKKIIYLDHAATTATRPEVVDAMLPYFTENFWNPSSVYTPALNNRKVIDESRDTIAKSLGTTPENIYFTAGGSESDNWALNVQQKLMQAKENISSQVRSSIMRSFIHVNILKKEDSRSHISMLMKTES